MMEFKKYLEQQQQQNQVQQQPQQNQVQQQQPQQNQVLNQVKTSLITAIQQEFQKNPQGALTWFNNLYTKVLPSDYKKMYDQWQQTQKNPPSQQNVQK